MYEDQYDMAPQAQSQPQPVPPQQEGFSFDEKQRDASTVLETLHPSKGGDQGNSELEQWAKEKDFEYKEREQQLKELAQDRRDARDDEQSKHKMQLDERRAKLERKKSISDRTTARINQQGQVKSVDAADRKQMHEMHIKDRDQVAKEKHQQAQLQLQAQQAQQAQQAKLQQQSQQAQQAKSKPLGSGKYS